MGADLFFRDCKSSPVFLPDTGYTDIGNIVCSGSAAVLAEVGVRSVDLSAGAFPV